MFGLYSQAPGFVDSSPTLNDWTLGRSSIDPLQRKAQELVAYCFPNPALFSPDSTEAYECESLKTFLTGSNLKAFLHEYRHYHPHWPLIHIPTFDALSASNSLVLAICCLGAVYSDRLDQKEVRFLMDIVRPAVLRSSEIYKMSQAPEEKTYRAQNNPGHVEEIMALALLHSQMIWHGSPEQRKQGRDEFSALVKISRRAGLLQPLPRDTQGSSALHQPGPVTGEEVNTWDWMTWVENERRARLMAFIFLIDASSTIFFNTQPQFDVYEVRIPLPADDAAWEAKTAEDCASALGLRGQAAQTENESGSRRAKQLDMPEALQVLYGAGPGQFPQRATNAFGKFSKTYRLRAV